MKRHILLILLLGASLNVVAASSSLPTKQVNIPFNNEAIISSKHSGLTLNYDMSAKPTKKIVCELSNIYKSWLEFSDQGVFKESGVFGTYQTVIFTTKEHNHNINNSTAVYHADTTGKIKINETLFKSYSGKASCHYEIDVN